MTGRLLTLDATRAKIAGKTVVALLLGFGIGLKLNWRLSYMGIVIVVLQTAALGATVKKGLLYIAGTLAGAVAGLSLVGLLAHQRGLFTLGMVLLVGGGVYALQGSRRPYAWMIFLITAALVGWLSAQDTPRAFGTAVMRASTICLGVALTVLVHGVLWPIRAGDAFDRQLPDFIRDCRDLLTSTTRGRTGPSGDAGGGQSAAALGRKMDGLRAALDAALGDTERFRRCQAGYRELLDQLDALMLAILSFREGPAFRCGRSAEATGGGSRAFHAAAGTLAAEMDDLLRVVERSRDGAAPAAAGREGPRAPRLGESDAADPVSGAVLADAVDDLSARISRLRATAAGVEDPRRRQRKPPPRRERFSVKSARFRQAGTAGLATLAAVLLFMRVNWPQGLGLAMIFVTLVVVLDALLPISLIRGRILWSLAVGPAIAAVLYFGIMRSTSRYDQLAPWLAAVFFPLLYLMSSPNPRTSMPAMTSTIFVILLMALDADQSFSFAAFMNNWIGLAGGFGVTFGVLALASDVTPEREYVRKLRAVFAACGESMRDARRPGPAASAEVGRPRRERWRKLRKQLRLWAGAVDPRRNDRQAAEHLIETIDHATVRLAAAEQAWRRCAGRIPRPLREPIDRVYDACVESFQRIEQALRAGAPVPDLPDTADATARLAATAGEFLPRRQAGRGVSAASAHALATAAQLRALADAIGACRDGVNAVDWGAWNRNHF